MFLVFFLVGIYLHMNKHVYNCCRHKLCYNQGLEPKCNFDAVSVQDHSEIMVQILIPVHSKQFQCQNLYIFQFSGSDFGSR